MAETQSQITFKPADPDLYTKVDPDILLSPKQEETIRALIRDELERIELARLPSPWT